MRIFSSLLAAVAALAVFCGCDHSLDYVPDNANFVAYGNTKALLNTKLWKVVDGKTQISKELVQGLGAVAGIKEIGELSGNITVWGEKPDAPEGVVIVLDNRKAEELVKEMAAKLKASGQEVKESKIGGCTALVMPSPLGAGNMTVIAAGKKVLHISLSKESSAAFKKNSGNPLVKAIDRDAVLSVAVSPKLYGEIDKSAATIEGIGISAAHLYINNKEAKLKATLDIRDIK